MKTQNQELILRRKQARAIADAEALKRGICPVCRGLLRAARTGQYCSCCVFTW